MQIISMGGIVPDRAIEAYGSQGFSLARLVPNARVACAHVAAGGRIGLHPTTADQLLVALNGSVQVTGDQAEPVTIEPGRAVLWRAGECHETCALTDFTGLIIEAVDCTIAVREG